MRRRTALVTGGARGQGLAIVRRLLDTGFQLAAGDVLEEEMQRNHAGLSSADLLSLRLDVTDASSWSDAVSAVEERFGGLDVLVNNAGIIARAPFLETSAEEVERLWRVNCLGQFLGMQAAARLLSAGERPVIVNTLSMAAVQAAPNVAAYASSKWAARGMTLAAALELAELGIRVNSIHPGPIATSMLDGPATERLSKVSLLGRIGSPEDVAGVVAFLVSADADWMTGTEIVIDGGSGIRRR